MEQIRQLIKIAIPVIISQFAIMGMGITDVIIAGHASGEDLAGMALGNQVTNFIVFFFFGIGLIAHPVIGREFGKHNNQGIKIQIHQLIWSTLFCGVICLALLLFGAWILQLMNFETGMRTIAKNYILVMSMSAIIFPVISTLRASIEAMGQTRIVMMVNLLMFIVNIPLDYLIVYGKLNMPAMGGVGCALATVVLHWAMLLLFILILHTSKKNKDMKIFSSFSLPDISNIKTILKLGIPLGGTIIMEYGFFAACAFVIAFYGEVATGANAIAISIAGLCYMIYLGLGQANTILISQLIGAKHFELAWSSCKYALWFSFVITFVPMGVIYFFGSHIVALFSNEPDVIQLAEKLLLWAILFQIGDSLHINFLCAIRGYGDTVGPVKLQVLGFWIIAFPFGISLHFWNWLPFINGPSVFWLAMIIGLTLTAIMLSVRLFRLHRTYPSHSELLTLSH